MVKKKVTELDEVVVTPRIMQSRKKFLQGPKRPHGVRAHTKKDDELVKSM